MQNDIQAKKTISAFPSTEQRRDGSNAFILEEGEVYHLDVTVTNAPTGNVRYDLMFSFK